MCDTVVKISEGGCWLAKNSDREPQEAQLTEWLDSGHYRAGKTQATYLEIEVPEKRNRCWISRPYWMWGAEMGVNEQGVAIGNEAVFTKLIDRKYQKLLGMDLIRLALEQASDAEAALHVIIHYLEKYGQGGSAGDKNKNFRYDNSFLIIDKKCGWQLETAGKFWVAKKIETGIAAISNSLSIEYDFDLYSKNLMDDARKQGFWNGKGDFNFTQTFSTRFMPWAGKARDRRACNLNAAYRIGNDGDSTKQFATLLRQHVTGDTASSNGDVCMHAKNIFRPSQTTQSMIVHNHSSQSDIWATGTSLPCLSSFKMVSQDANGFLELHNNHWQQWQTVLTKVENDSSLSKKLKDQNKALEQKLWSRPSNHLEITKDWWQSIQKELLQ